MEKEVVKPLYTKSKENIKFPTYYNPELESLLQSEVDLTSLNESFTFLFNTIDEYTSNYFNALQANIHSMRTLFESNKKNAASYLLLAKGVKTLCLIIQSKIAAQSNVNVIIIEETIDHLVKAFHEENDLGSILKKCFKSEEEIRSLLAVFLQYETNLLAATNRCGLVIIDTAVKYSTFVFKEAIRNLHNFTSINQFANSHYSKKEQRANDMILFQLILTLEKFSMMGLCFNNGFFINENDILNKSENSPEWEGLKRILVRIVPSKEVQIKNGIDELRKGFGVMMVVLTEGFAHNSNFVNFFKTCGIGLHYLIKNEDALYDAMKLSINPNPNGPLLMCNVMSVNFMKTMAVRSYPKITCWKKIYLKRLVKEIDLEYIAKMNNYIFGRSDEFTSEINAFNDVFQTNQNLLSSEKPSELYLEKIDKRDKKLYVSTRLIHSSKIVFPKEVPTSFIKCCYNIKPNATQDTLMIHIHGGGFIGTTTTTHENYLRNWVNRLNIPLIGINYALSPKDKYPKAIDDIWQAYNWIIKHAEKEFNIKLRRIILSGDSAGGTLALSLTYLIILHQARLPDLLLLEYPCCDTSMQNMTNSMLLCMQDHLLSYNFLTYCNVSYRSNYPIDDDPFLNPERMPEHLLKRMPKTRFFIGTCDPLRDDTIRLLYKLSKTNVDCIGYDFKNYIHGFYALNSDVLKENPTEILLSEIEHFLKETHQ